MSLLSQASPEGLLRFSEPFSLTALCLFPLFSNHWHCTVRSLYAGYTGSSWYSPVLGKLRQEDGKSETSLAYIVRPCLKDKVSRGNLNITGVSRREPRGLALVPLFL